MSNKKKKIILVADDVKLFQFFVKQTLTSEDYELIFVQKGRQALDMVMKKDVDLLILDMELPDMNGLEVLRNIRNIPQIIIVTHEEILKEAAVASKQMNTVLRQLKTLSASIDKTNKEIRKVIKENSPRVAKVLDNTNALVLTSKSEIEKTMRDIRKFTETGKDVKKAIAKLENTTDKINTFIEKLQSEGLIAQIMEDKDLLNQIKTEVKHLQDTTLKLKSSAESFIKMTENINSLLDYVNQGKGSIGKFVKSDQLYNEVLDFVKDIKAHPWKLFIRKR